MRFLVVYQDFSQPAQKLVEQLCPNDVRILLVRKGEREASAGFLEEFKKYPKAPTAVCQVVRTFRKSIEPLLDIQYTTNKFRPDDQQLKEWLRPNAIEKEAPLAPSKALKEAALTAKHLVFANDALNSADELADHRWKFINTSALLLARYANGENLGPLRNWKQTHGVDFAPNGQVRYIYSISMDGAKAEGCTEWHLKEGDNTTRESAARIYFARVDMSGSVRICVFYVGPHPEDGDHPIFIDCSDG